MRPCTFICLDIFGDIIQNEDRKIENRLEEWLVFLSQDEPDMIIKLLNQNADFQEIYEEVYTICLNMERMMEMFSKELAILDRNTVKLMIDEMEEEVVEAKRKADEAVRKADEAEREFTVRFDGMVPKKTVIEKDELNSYLDEVDEDFKNAIIKAKNNIYDFHLRQAQQSWLTTKENGVIMGQRIRGLHRVGIYVPGGTAAYPSSVLMNAIPAKIAGVKEIIMVTPPGKDGNPNPDIMAAAA